MTIRSLWLQGMRNYANLAISFSDTITVIVGDNAVGKTNLLEAVYLLATGKSFRAESDRELIAFSAELARVKGIVTDKAADKKELEVVVTPGSVLGKKTATKRYAVNGVGKRMIDFVGCLRCVLFWPQDLELVTDSPSYRRRYLDRVLVQTDRKYRHALATYEHALPRRNRLLEAICNGDASPKELLYWNELLIEHGRYLNNARESYIAFLNTHSSPIAHDAIPKYHITYDSSIISDDRLQQYAEQEVQAGMTLVGPHRDDIKFSIKNDQSLKDLAKFGSRGEQRLSVLWLKMGESAYIEQHTGEKPVLLLDDIFSELDPQHRKILNDLIGNRQTIVTTTDLSHVDPKIQATSLIHRLPLS